MFNFSSFSTPFRKMPDEDTGAIYYFLKTHLNWEIPRFSILPPVAGYRIWSPNFGYFGEMQKFVCAPPGIKFRSETGWLSLSLTSADKEEDGRESIHVGVTDESGRIINNCECIWSCSHRGFYGARLINVEELSFRVEGKIPNGYLRLFCEFHPKYERESADAAIQTENKRGVDKLLENLKDLYANKETCDVTLIVKDKEYKAHRTILMARSSVFAATFNHNMLESGTNVINISDCDPDSFPKFLEYLYSGEFAEISVRDATNLYYTSDKYNIEELKTFCMEKLIQLMTIKTMCEIADFADKYGETQLFTVIQEFFNKNYMQIFVTDEWKDLLKNNHWLVNRLTTQMAKLHLNDSQTKGDDKMESTLHQDHISLTQGMAESSSTKWDCSVCYEKNPEDKISCLACETPRESKETKNCFTSKDLSKPQTTSTVSSASESAPTSLNAGISSQVSSFEASAYGVPTTVFGAGTTTDSSYSSKCFGNTPVQPSFGSFTFGASSSPAFAFGAGYHSTDKNRTTTASEFFSGTPAASEINANSFSANFSMNAPPNFNFNSTPAGPFQFAPPGYAAAEPLSTVNYRVRRVRKAVRRVTRREE